jgi:hypothetical protein
MLTDYGKITSSSPALKEKVKQNELRQYCALLKLTL